MGLYYHLAILFSLPTHSCSVGLARSNTKHTQHLQHCSIHVLCADDFFKATRKWRSQRADSQKASRCTHHHPAVPPEQPRKGLQRSYRWWHFGAQLPLIIEPGATLLFPTAPHSSPPQRDAVWAVPTALQQMSGAPRAEAPPWPRSPAQAPRPTLKETPAARPHNGCPRGRPRPGPGPHLWRPPPGPARWGRRRRSVRRTSCRTAPPTRPRSWAAPAAPCRPPARSAGPPRPGTAAPPPPPPAASAIPAARRRPPPCWDAGRAGRGGAGRRHSNGRARGRGLAEGPALIPPPSGTVDDLGGNIVVPRKPVVAGSAHNRSL